MATPTLFASSLRARPFGLVVAGVVLFLVSVGGSGALASAYTNSIAEALSILS